MGNEIKNEKRSWVIAEIIFLGLFIFISGWYSSYSAMGDWLKALVWIGRIGIAACVVVSWAKFNDPNYEKYRKATVVLAVVFSLIIGIHHAVAREDNQVQIDSKENAAKP